MKLIKFLISMIIISMLFQIIFIPNYSVADDSDINFSEIFKEGNDWIQKGRQASESEDAAYSGNSRNGYTLEKRVRDLSRDLYIPLVIIGAVLSVIVGGILGIKFLLASAEDKAKVKQSLIPYILGVFVIFSAFAIWNFTVIILNKMSQ